MSSDSDSDMETAPQPKPEQKKKKRLQDYLDEKAARETAERAEEELRRRRKRGLKDDEEGGEEVSYPVINPINFVKNKELRSKKFKRQQGLKKKEEKKARKARKLEGGPRPNGHTIESLREKDETALANTVEEEDNEEIANDLQNDEFNEYYAKSYEPKVLITYNATPHSRTRRFGAELERILPNSMVHSRNKATLKKVCKSAVREEFTDLIVINENHKQPEGMLVIHLPDGPTAHFKVSNYKSLRDLRKRRGVITSHRPEVILTNFTTRLGLTVGRMLGALFHYDPEFKGRRCATFHNQRDYIFFRHHLYEFDKNGKRVKLRELGPRFTLKLRSLQSGLFDSKCGDYEWMITNKRHLMESRRRFFL